ncbi:DUF1934 domain-containing protein [Paenibacillus sp. KN14-4R]|uniref:DUF1934 domain-containing protein n=1 Tax=Paenibacillus sp. KN14-4R TaxID=3445773 RepID=UPI003F9F657F
MKQQVRITIDSTNGDQQLLQHAEGDLYLKNGHIYIRYEEIQEELGRTTTLLKFSDNQFRIIRQGETGSEQTFLPGEWTEGWYHTAQGRLDMRIRTHSLQMRLDENGLGDAKWNYDLYVAGDHAGRFKIKLSIKKMNDNQEG